MDDARDGSLAAQLTRAIWRKSSYSNPNGNCVETAVLTEGDVAVRDSQLPDGPVLVIPAEQWRALLARVRSGEFG